ncbi:MAG TPA: hypothetical protein VHL34_02230, partial [Rhizomicrobium sp.]|nr:hypothetical protein [Rhizomicrobium sp.]
RAESPSRLSPSEIGSTSFFVAEKPLDAPEPETFARPAVKAEAAPPPPGGEVFKTAFFGTLDDGDDPQDKKDLLRSALSEAAFAAVQDGKVVFANTMANSANCKPRCAQMIEKSVGQIESAGIIKALDLEGFGIPEETRFTQEPVGAFLRENYQEMVFGDQAKRRIDRAKRNEYICTVFRFRDYQEDLQKISEKVPKRDASNFPPLRHDCPYHGQFNFGCFDQGKLIAYIQVAVRGEIAFLLRVAADGEVRPFLTVETVRHVFETYPAVQVVFQRARSPDALVGMGATVSELAIVAPHTSVDTSAEDDDE